MKKRTFTRLFFAFLLLTVFPFSTMAYAASQAEPIELKVTSFIPPTLDISRVAEEWARRVEKECNGMVKLVYYWSGSLASEKDTYRAMLSGLADIGMWVIGTVPGMHTLNEFTTLPLMGWDDLYTISRIYHDMRNKFPELDAEFKGLKYLYATSGAPTQLFMTKKIVRVPEDLRGLRIQAYGNWEDTFRAMGAALVVKGPQDWYMSLEKGLVDGHINSWPSANAFKIPEVAPITIEPGVSGFNSAFVGWWMNIDSWNRLPKEAQEAFMSQQDWVERELNDLNIRLEKEARSAAVKNGNNVITLTPDEIKRWQEVTEPERQKWVKSMDAKELPGTAIYEEALRLIEKYNKSS